MTSMRLAAIVAATAALWGLGVAGSDDRCPEAPPYSLLPADWPCAVVPACGTQYGVCRLPYVAFAGQPCHCQGPDGNWVPGVCIRGSDFR
jgi:hypothetical protein